MRTSFNASAGRYFDANENAVARGVTSLCLCHGSAIPRACVAAEDEQISPLHDGEYVARVDGLPSCMARKDT